MSSNRFNGSRDETKHNQFMESPVSGRHQSPKKLACFHSLLNTKQQCFVCFVLDGLVSALPVTGMSLSKSGEHPEALHCWQCRQIGGWPWCLRHERVHQVRRWRFLPAHATTGDTTRALNFAANRNLSVFRCYCRWRRVEATFHGVAQESLHCWTGSS